jgi:hypothetical protein
MEAEISLYRYGTTDFNDLTGLLSVPSRSAIYVGKARLWQANDGTVIVTGDADISSTVTNISIPWNGVEPQRDDIAVVTYSPIDDAMLGKAFRVVSVDGGGLIGATRRMRCIALAESASWSP